MPLAPPDDLLGAARVPLGNAIGRCATFDVEVEPSIDLSARRERLVRKAVRLVPLAEDPWITELPGVSIELKLVTSAVDAPAKISTRSGLATVAAAAGALGFGFLLCGLTLGVGFVLLGLSLTLDVVSARHHADSLLGFALDAFDNAVHAFCWQFMRH